MMVCMCVAHYDGIKGPLKSLKSLLLLFPEIVARALVPSQPRPNKPKLMGVLMGV
jgi:hypothetical protein